MVSAEPLTCALTVANSPTYRCGSRGTQNISPGPFVSLRVSSGFFGFLRVSSGFFGFLRVSSGILVESSRSHPEVIPQRGNGLGQKQKESRSTESQ